MDEPIGNIVDVFPDAIQGPAKRITVGCFILDVLGDRHPVTRVWKGKTTISLARDNESSATVTWKLDEIVTYVPLSQIS